MQWSRMTTRVEPWICAMTMGVVVGQVYFLEDIVALVCQFGLSRSSFVGLTVLVKAQALSGYLVRAHAGVRTLRCDAGCPDRLGHLRFITLSHLGS